MVAEQICYFVDEAGDGTLFNAEGKVIVGQQGCSRFFVLGLLWAESPAELDASPRELHERLTGDPYFAGVPSMQPGSRKTAVAFHAKDDLPEVRYEVFRFATAVRRNTGCRLPSLGPPEDVRAW